ncbi:MAG: hypothetical protein GF353_23510 [Candidatus Lokiarchaeota archaeon]|nr:hypothetical protein [Candidatus Lokiarchaeota archaeon]
MKNSTKWFNEKWWISPLNFKEEIREQMSIPEKAFVRDSTIREGEETPGVYYSLEEKIKIVEYLEEIGVEHIDCGYIGQVKDQWDLANEIKQRGLNLNTYSHLSSNPQRWRDEIKKSQEAQIDFIGFGIVLTPWQLELFSGKKEITPEVMVSLIGPTLKKIRRLGAKAILDCVDATRSDLSILKKAIKKGIKNGVKMVMLYDTVGACNIPAITHLIKEVKTVVGNIPIGIHVHDDFGLGTASTIAAIEQGAIYMDLVANKLGDRAGNTSLEEVVVALEMHYGIDTGIDLSKLYDFCKFIERVSGVKLPDNKPVVGKNTFLHESELHVMSALDADNYWMCFTPYKPEVVGQKENIIFGPTTLHGDAIKIKCEKMGIDNPSNYQNAILDRAHELITKKKYITEKELEALIKEITNSSS